MRLSERLMEYYTYLFYVLCFGAIAASISYTFRSVRGSYGVFSLADSNAVYFFFGAMLIASALFAAVACSLGPVGMSASQLFWRYPARAHLPRNPWNSAVIWGAVILWALLAVLLATILAPFSITWLVGAASVAVLFGIVLVQWTLASQLSGRNFVLNTWAVTTALAGIAITVWATTSQAISSDAGTWVMALTIGLAGIGLLAAMTQNLTQLKTPLTWEKAVSGAARRSLVLNALSAVGSPDGYKFYGVTRRTLQAKFRSISPAVISLLAALDSILIMLAVLALSVPLGIFFATSFGTFGVGVTLAVGAWLIALLFRWHAREWTAQASLRTWLGAPSLRTLVGFCAGPALMTTLYVLGVTLVFGLPWHLALVGLFLGFYVALGEVNPPTQISYDLTVTTAEGIMIPVEPAIMVGKNLVLIVVVAVALYIGALVPVLGLAVLIVWRLLSHFLGQSPGDYLWRLIRN